MTESLRRHPKMTIAEYLDFEAAAEGKHEYVDGEIIDMSGGSEAASLIATNIMRELGNALKGKPCRVYDSNLRVRIGRKHRYRYPDALVICGPTASDPDDPRKHTVTNPRVVVEVLSPSTERIDRVQKFADYRGIESFEEYVLVSQDEPTIETFHRQPDGAWRLGVQSGAEATTSLASLGVTLAHREVFANVDFPPAEPHPQRVAANEPE